MRLRSITLQAPADRLTELTRFYCAQLRLAGVLQESAGQDERPSLAVRVGASELHFDQAPEGDAPFYHFALLVPGDRFSAALDWARERVQLLEIEDSAETVIHFASWDADSCYFHDPAGNIVELIAHAGHAERHATGPFGAEELVGICEIGLVGDVAADRAALERIGIEAFQDGGALTFLGEPTAALILADPGYGWLPRGRAAEPWPVAVDVERLSGASATAVSSGPHRVQIRVPRGRAD